MATVRESGATIILRAFPTARSLWQIPATTHRDHGRALPDSVRGNHRTFDLECFQINGCLVIVQDFTHGNGWTMYTQPYDGNRIDETLIAIGRQASTSPIITDDDTPAPHDRINP